MFMQASDFEEDAASSEPVVGSVNAAFPSSQQSLSDPSQRNVSSDVQFAAAPPTLEHPDMKALDSDDEEEYYNEHAVSPQEYHPHQKQPQPQQKSPDSPSGNAANVNNPQARKQRLIQQRKEALKRRERNKQGGMVRSRSGIQLKDEALRKPIKAESTAPAFHHVHDGSFEEAHLSQGSGANSGGMGSARGDVRSLLQEREQNEENAQLSRVEKNLREQGIEAVFDPVGPTAQATPIDLSDRRTFMSQPLPQGIILQCEIVRQKTTLSAKWYPTYHLQISPDDNNAVTADDQKGFLLAAKRRPGNKTSNYIICSEAKDLDKHSAGYLGKVRSNFVGTEFSIYDKGQNPKNVDAAQRSITQSAVRQELGAVFYESNLMGSRGPRKMLVAIPRVELNGARTVFRPIMQDDPSIVTTIKADHRSKDIMVMENKSPQWNSQVNAYVLNFNGRVTMASVKNFQLVFDEDPDAVILQFGKVDKDRFTMDFQWPLSPLQAFAICLSSFDYKIACE